MIGGEPFFTDYVIIDGEDVFGFPDQTTFDKYIKSYQDSGRHEMLIIKNRYFILKPK